MQDINVIKKCAEIASGCDNQVASALSKIASNPKAHTPSLLEMYGKSRDKYVVIISDPYVTPDVPEAAETREAISQEAFRRMQNASMYEDKPVSSNIRNLIKSIIRSQAFKEEADKIFLDSLRNDREMGALRVYFRGAMFFVYSVGKPSEKSKSAMRLEPVDNSFGFHVFTWHPHPKGNPEPTARSDLRTSYREQRPGVVKYGKRNYQITIYMGDLK